MSTRVWKLYPGSAAVVITCFLVLPNDGWWRVGWQVGVGYGGAAAIVVGVRRFALAAGRDRVSIAVAAAHVSTPVSASS
jgi:hypothetical protein